jgi:hypothetical protein
MFARRMTRTHTHRVTVEYRILPPRRGETIAISDTPKASALFFDRIWSYSDDEVPSEVRCFAGTKWEFQFAEFRIFGLPTWKYIHQLAKDGRERECVAILRQAMREMPFFLAQVRMFSLFTDKCGDEFLKRNTKLMAGVQIACFFKTFASLLRKDKVMRVVPVFPNCSVRNMQYREGERRAVQAVLSNVGIVDENALSWAQVMELRKDVDARRKYRRFLHWLDRDMVGKSLGYVQDEIASRLEDYKWALKKHGVKLITGTIEETLDGKYLAGVSGATASLSLAGLPTLGILTGAGLVLGRVVVKLVEQCIDRADLKRGPNSEICWVYEVQRLQHGRRGRQPRS